MKELHVPSRLVVGTMNFGKRTPAKEAERIIESALERGLTVFDTADAYNEGESERITGRALKKHRDRCVLLSKVGLAREGGKPTGLSPAAIRRCIQGSLERLQTDYLDVYYLHAPDHATPIEETLATMAELVEKGQVRAWGVSNYASWQVLEMIDLAKGRMPKPIVSQVIYNLLIREIEIEHLRFTKRYGIHTMGYNALAGGLLSGAYAKGDAIKKGSRFDGNAMYQRRYWSERMFELVDALRPIAEAAKLSLVDFSYAWLFGREGVDSVLLGPATLEQLDQAISASKLTLSKDAVAAADLAHKTWLGTDTHYVR